MKKWTKISLTIASIVLGVFAIWGVGSIIYNHTNWTYSGKIMFNTIEEYTQFKLTMGTMEPEDVYKLQVLSSEPPIIAFFTVGVSPHTNFPYGVHNKILDWTTALATPFIIGAFGLSILISGVIWNVLPYNIN